MENANQLTTIERQNMLYTLALAPCLARDLFDRNDKKSSATYFEYFIGHLFAKKFGVNPAAKESFCIGDKNVSLPTDFLFKTNSMKIHMPVKTSYPFQELRLQNWCRESDSEIAVEDGYVFIEPSRIPPLPLAVSVT